MASLKSTPLLLSLARSLHSEAALPHPLFRRWMIRPGVFGIEERFFDSWNRANLFYIVGKEKDLLIDTGTGLHNLPSYLSWLRLGPFTSEKKPLSVVLTHCHFDHSGGLHQFEVEKQHGPVDLCMHAAEVNVLLSGDQSMTASWVTKEEVLPKPSATWTPRDYSVKKVRSLRSLQQGDSIDLGDWKFKVLHLPGHSPGSLGLLDEKEGVLASGDTLYRTEHELVDWYPGSSVRDMRTSVESIHTLAESGRIELLLPGHNEELTSREAILSAAARHLDMSSPFRRRCVAKAMSRFRANCLIRTNRVLPVSDAFRELLKS